MGLLDNVAGQILGGSGGGQQGNLLNAVMGLLGNQQTGGLGGLVQQLTGKGLGDIVNSWISTGQNLPITPQQLQHGLGTDIVSQIAAKAGLSPDQVTLHLSELLPKVVDKLTPNGTLPESNEMLSKGMQMLQGLLK